MALSLGTQVLTVQDRVIRLEMRLRLAQAAAGRSAAADRRAQPRSSWSRCGSRATPSCPALVREVLGGTLTDTEGHQDEGEELAGRLLESLTDVRVK